MKSIEVMEKRKLIRDNDGDGAPPYTGMRRGEALALGKNAIDENFTQIGKKINEHGIRARFPQ